MLGEMNRTGHGFTKAPVNIVMAVHVCDPQHLGVEPRSGVMFFLGYLVILRSTWAKEDSLSEMKRINLASENLKKTSHFWRREEQIIGSPEIHT